LKKLDTLIRDDAEMDAVVFMSRVGGLPPLEELILRYDTPEHRETAFWMGEVEVGTVQEEELEDYLEEQNLVSRSLVTLEAFHSSKLLKC